MRILILLIALVFTSSPFANTFSVENSFNKDEQGDFGQYEALVEKLDKMKYPYESVVYDREQHSLYDINNQKDYYNKLFKFFEKYIGK